MSVPMTLNQAADLIDVSIQDIFLKTSKMKLGSVNRLYNEVKTDDYYTKDSGISGFGEAARLTENAIITSESPVQTFDKTYTQVFHAKMGQFTQYEWKFGIQKRKLEKVVNDLLVSCKRKEERLLTEYIENSIGSATSYTVSDDSGNWTKSVVGGDGVAMINSSHTREDGGAAWSNVISDGTTTNMDFDVDGQKGMYRTGSLVRDPKGNLMDVNYNLFVFRKGSPIAFRAAEINGALRSNKVPESFDNDGAPFSAFDVIVLPYLSTSTSAYWWGVDESLKGDDMGPQLKRFESASIEPSHKDYKTKTIYTSAQFAFDYGHNDARNWAGSTGTNS